MKPPLGAFALLGLVILVAGCGASSVGDGASACPDMLRFEGVEYRGVDVTDVDLRNVGRGIRGECADVGGKTGVTFPEDGETVAVGSIAGYDPRQVLGAEGPDGTVSFYVASDLPQAVAERLARRLGG